MSVVTESNVEAVNEQCKRPHEDCQSEPNKKLCTEEGGVKQERQKKKKKYAMLMGYYGKKYYGMQRNTTFSTIEEQLLQALNKSGCITSKELQEIYLIKFQRAARTDKGVSAVQQVVSLILPESCKVQDINVHLPSDIRVFDIKRVTKHFDSKCQCNGRTYSYTLPTYIFSQSPLDRLLEESKDYRIPEDVIKKIDDLLSSYVGCHNFHNFTSRKAFNDPSAKRYIMSFKSEEPFTSGKEFVTLKIMGQSFMLHQIRKMVGMLIVVIRGMRPPEWFQEAWKSEKLSVPLAPGSGLLLEQVHYDKYNRKFGDDGVHEKLTWDEVADEVKNFRKYLINGIVEDELENNIMYNWLEYISNRGVENDAAVDADEKDKANNADEGEEKDGSGEKAADGEAKRTEEQKST